MQNKIVVGKFGKTFGVHGWMKIHSFTHPAENIVNFTPWFISVDQKQPAWREIAAQQWEMKGQVVVVKLPDITSPESAQIYTNQLIAVNREQLPTLTDGDIYWADLIGLTVVNTAGQELGKVERLIATSANDVLVVRETAKETPPTTATTPPATQQNQKHKQQRQPREHMIPYLKRSVLNVDFAARKILVDWED